LSGNDGTSPVVVDDGVYDVFIIDATPEEPGADTTGTPGARWVVELTILAGEHKGAVVAVRAGGIGDDEIALIGMPGTLTVTNGVPALRIDH
jgi:hypothetical protein